LLQERYAEAEPLFLRALAITERERGCDHLEVAAPLYGLVQLYNAQGRYREAESLYRRARSIDEQEAIPEQTDDPKSLTKRLSVHILIQKCEHVFV